MDNELARSISNAGLKIQYDALCRQVLSHRNILAWILKHTTEEFKTCSIEEISDYIEGTPAIGSIPVSPGETNSASYRYRSHPGSQSERITSMANESRVHGEGVVYYDIHFSVRLPQKRQETSSLPEFKKLRLQNPGNRQRKIMLLYLNNQITILKKRGRSKRGFSQI